MHHLPGVHFGRRGGWSAAVPSCVSPQLHLQVAFGGEGSNVSYVLLHGLKSASKSYHRSWLRWRFAAYTATVLM